MQKNPHPTATAGGLFKTEVPEGELPTVFPAELANTLVLELANAVEGAGITLDPQDDAQLAAAIPLLGGSEQVGGTRNLCLNGTFRLWQRGATIDVPSGGAYTADRWRATSGAEVRRETIDPTATIGDGIELRSIANAASVSTASALGCRFEQRVEAPERLSGRTVTFSVYHRHRTTGNAHAYSFDLELALNYGAGGDVETILDTTVVSVPQANPAEWRRAIVTATVPDLEGATLGTDPYLACRLDSVETGQTVYASGGGVLVTGAQLEVGAIATTVQELAPALEHAAALRYFETSYPWGIAPGTPENLWGFGSTIDGFEGAVIGTAGEPGSAPWHPVRFRVPKRIASPVVTVYHPTNGTAGEAFVDDGANDPMAVANINRLSDQGWAALNFAGSIVAATNFAYHYTADAEL